MSANSAERSTVCQHAATAQVWIGSLSTAPIVGFQGAATITSGSSDQIIYAMLITPRWRHPLNCGHRRLPKRSGRRRIS